MRKSKNKFYIDVGFRIRQVRSLNKVSQEGLGAMLGVSPQTVQRYETGEIQIPTEAVAKCARALHIPVGFFYGEDNQQPANTNINRVGLMVAAEIMGLPDDNIRKSIYQLGHIPIKYNVGIHKFKRVRFNGSMEDISWHVLI